MSKPKRHLHRDYTTAWCGRDISHVPATYEAADASCARCQSEYVKDAEKALQQAKTDAASAVAAAEAALAERRKATGG